MPNASEVIGGVTFIVVRGDHLDASNADSFKAQTIPELGATPNIVLDLRELRFVDSSGMGVLLSCLRHVQGQGGDLRLCGLTPQVQMLFELVRMHRIFPIYKTREQAALSFGQS